MTVKITRGDATAQDLPRLAGQVKDGRVARRLLAIALVLEPELWISDVFHADFGFAERIGNQA